MSFDKDSIKTVKQALEICKSYRAKKEALEEFAGADAAIQAKIQEYDTIIQGCTQLVMFGDLPIGGSSTNSSSFTLSRSFYTRLTRSPSSFYLNCVELGPL